MSKTIRRKHEKAPYWHTSELVKIDPGKWTCKWVPLTGEKLKAGIRKYHSDTGVGYEWAGNTPAFFRRGLDRIKRAKCKQELRRINKQGDYEEYSFKPFKKDAAWFYW